MNPTATRVYQYPALIVLERLILSCYLAYPALQTQFDRGFRSFTVDSETPLWRERWAAIIAGLCSCCFAVRYNGV